jgi:hypothetical protein
VLEPWEDQDTRVSAVQEAYGALPAGGDAAAEDVIFAMLFDVFAHRKHQATTLPAIKPTVAEFLARPDSLTFRLPDYDPHYPVFDYTDIIDCSEDHPELEALHRWAMVLHNKYRGTGPVWSLCGPASSPTTTWSSRSIRGTPRSGGSCAAYGAACRADRRPRRGSPGRRYGRSPRSTSAGSSRSCRGWRRWPPSTGTRSAAMRT